MNAGRIALERFEHAGFAWQARPDGRAVVEELCRRLPDPTTTGAVTVKASQARVVWRLELGGQTMYVKRYRVRGWSERLKYLAVPPRALAEWTAAVRLEEAGIEAAPPVAVGVARRGPWLSDALFIAREVPGEPYDVVLDRLRAAGLDRGPLLEETALLLRRLVEADVFHPDLHGGNMLGRVEAGRPRLALVDLHALRFPRALGGRARSRMLAKLAHSLWLMLDRADLDRALALLTPDAGAAAALREQMARVERVRLRSRSKRCVTESTEFTRDRADGWTVWRRRDAPLDALLSLAGAPTGAAGVLSTGAGPRAVEVLRATSSLGPLWRAAHALRVRGIPSPLAHAWLERRALLGVSQALLVRDATGDARPLTGLDAPARVDAGLRAAASEVAARLHEVGLRVDPSRLLAARVDDAWRVVVIPDGALPSDRPVDEAGKAADQAALTALLDAGAGAPARSG